MSTLIIIRALSEFQWQNLKGILQHTDPHQNGLHLFSSITGIREPTSSLFSSKAFIQKPAFSMSLQAY